MYGFPADLDLSSALGAETTQFCVGPYDLQFKFGDVAFAVQSRIELLREGSTVAAWESGRWPDAEFYEAFSSPLVAAQLLGPKCLRLALESGLELHLFDDSEQYESLQIYTPAGVVIV